MPDPKIAQRLRGLVLSAKELVQLNPDWKPAMVEDYLNILDSIILLAQELDDIVDQTQGVTRVTNDYTIAYEDGTIFADTTSNDITLDLPSGQNGEVHMIVHSAKTGNKVYLVPNGTEEIYGENATVTLYNREVLDLQFQTEEGWH